MPSNGPLSYSRRRPNFKGVNRANLVILSSGESRTLLEVLEQTGDFAVALVK
jgi:hypothetical protein